jgi:hypothetical protein
MAPVTSQCLKQLLPSNVHWNCGNSRLIGTLISSTHSIPYNGGTDARLFSGYMTWLPTCLMPTYSSSVTPLMREKFLNAFGLLDKLICHTTISVCWDNQIFLTKNTHEKLGTQRTASLCYSWNYFTNSEKVLRSLVKGPKWCFQVLIEASSIFWNLLITN